jgi:secreted PhoX family phosphatase
MRHLNVPSDPDPKPSASEGASGVSRRQFVHAIGITAGFLGLGRLLQAQPPGGAGGRGAPGGRGNNPIQPYLNEIEGYGPLIPDPKRIFDLPAGFSYKVISRSGEIMSDGLHLPGQVDGMAAFAGPDGRVILVRNHELDPPLPQSGPFGADYYLLPKVDTSRIYDAGKGRPHNGGTSTLVYDPVTKTTEKMFLSLSGTMHNCAGGPTPWGTWITCEEAVEGVNDNNEKEHGYNFEVPASTEMKLTVPVPLKAMGRFNHEAVAVDPRTSIVYQTEDRSDGLIYRFIPNTPRQLAAGGKLQVLAVKGRKTYETRNYPETGGPTMRPNIPMAVQWLDIGDVESPKDDLRTRGAALGAAVFARGEGMWFGNNEVFFACTNGGLTQRGQIFRYRPSPAEGTPGEDANPGTLELYLEPNNSALLESCDNVMVAPWGDLIICEDNAAPAPVVGSVTGSNYLRGVTPEGKIYTLGRNRYLNISELAGICFAPNHPTMFVNIQVPGLTLAITGPWESLKKTPPVSVIPPETPPAVAAAPAAT